MEGRGEEIERLLVRVEASAAVFERQTKQINRALYGMTAEVRKTRQQFKREMDAMGRDFYRPVQAASALALGAVTAFSYQAAKRAEAVDGAFEQTFRAMPEKARKAVAAVSNDFKRLETDVKDNFTQLGAVLVALGVDAGDALSMVDALQRRSLDMAAFRDVSDADAFRAVISGITGETEPLKRFGIVVNETALKAELLRLGFKGSSTEASESAKAIARTNIILRASKEMQGQVAREAENVAEKEKRARAEFVKAAEDFGTRFLPVAADVLEWAVDALEAFNDLPDGVQSAGLALLALIAAGGPIAGAIKGLQALIKAAVAARVALAAVGGSGVAGAAGGAAAGAAAGAAGRTALGVLGTGAAIVTAPLLLGGDTPQRRLEGQERINSQLREEARVRQLIARLQREGNTSEAARQSAYLGRVESNRRAGQQRLAAAQAPAQDAAGDEGQTGDFGLSEAQKHGLGNARSGRGGARSSSGDAERIAEARQALELERAIAVARASGDEAAIKAAEEREQLARLIQQYTDAGSADAEFEATSHLALLNQAVGLAEDREKTEEQIDLILQGRQRQMEREAEYQQRLHDQLMDQLAMRAEIARLAGDEGLIRRRERELWIEERITELMRLRGGMDREAFRGEAEGDWQTLDDADQQGRFRDLVVAAGEDFGDLAEDAGARFKQRAMEGLADLIWKFLTQIKFGGEGGNLGKALINGLGTALGRRASGGPVMAGKPYLVGENRPEVFVPAANGNILPHVRSAAAAGVQPRAVAAPVHFDLRGAVVTADLLDQMNRISAARASAAGVAAYERASADIPARLAHERRYSR